MHDIQRLTTVINEKTADKMTMQQVSDLIDQKVSERMSHRDAQDQQIRAYLQRLDTDRPAEGTTLIETFRVMYDDQQDLRRRFNLTRRPWSIISALHKGRRCQRTIH